MLRRQSSLTAHALQRLQQRSSVRESQVLELLDSDLSVLIGFEEFTSIAHRVLFIAQDQKFLVAVLDTHTGEVLTFLPVNYWRTLRANKSNTYRIKNDLTREMLFRAMQLINPEHEFLKHPPVSGKRRIHITLCGVRRSDEKYVRKRAGSIAISTFLEFSNSEADDWIIASIRNRLATYSMTVQNIIVSGSKRVASLGDVKLVYNLETPISKLRNEIQTEYRRRVSNGLFFPVMAA